MDFLAKMFQKIRIPEKPGKLTCLIISFMNVLVFQKTPCLRLMNRFIYNALNSNQKERKGKKETKFIINTSQTQIEMWLQNS